MAGPDYDVDYFGQDDGSSRDPNDSFRLIFQLGAGYFIYLYVVGMAQPDGLGRFTTFWLKDIVAVDIEMEEYGEQDLVEGCLRGAGRLRGRHAVARRAGDGALRGDGMPLRSNDRQPATPVLTMRWRLSDDAVLVWTVPRRTAGHCRRPRASVRSTPAST